MSSERSMALALLLLAGCEIERVGIPRTEALISMHGVLSASARTQVVLLERTRNGSVAISLPPFDLNDPIGSDAGIAESGALVRLTTPGGDVLVAREDVELEGGGRGVGIYRFALAGDALERNATYRVSVQTSRGEVLTGETSVPAGAVALTPALRVFDRAHDTVVVAWPPAAGARSYFVRIETPFGPRSFFTDSTRVRLVGELRNVELSAMPRVFIPGFPQAVTVSAVDSNYYHWYRTHNDELSGTGLIHSVRGGLGVFGSLVRLHFESFDVVVPQSDPEAGVFRFSGSPAEQEATQILGIDLYVESRAARSDQADALSGRYHKRPRLGASGCITCGVLGSTREGRIELALLGDWYARDTADVLIGEIRGDTIIGRYRAAGGIARFVKQR